MLTAVMAAPNSTRIWATVIHSRQSPQATEKWMLEIDIHAAQALAGPQAAYPGQRRQAFTIRPACDLQPRLEIEAEAEYIGGPHQGMLRLTGLRPCAQPGPERGAQ